MANFDFIKLPYLGIFGLELEKTIVIFETSRFSKCKVSC